jgi:hypothetical protein
MLPLIVIVAQLSTAQIDAAKATYQQLPPANVEAKQLDVPPADAHRIDVSAKIRSTSFGHKTWLLVAPDGTRFWVEWSKSTNRPAALFGPFPIATADKDKPGPGTAAPGKTDGGTAAPAPGEPKPRRPLIHVPPPPEDGPKRPPPLPKS